MIFIDNIKLICIFKVQICTKIILTKLNAYEREKATIS